MANKGTLNPQYSQLYGESNSTLLALPKYTHTTCKRHAKQKLTLPINANYICSISINSSSPITLADHDLHFKWYFLCISNVHNNYTDCRGQQKILKYHLKCLTKGLVNGEDPKESYKLALLNQLLYFTPVPHFALNFPNQTYQ
ncbi:hypothetical protein pb186bvf_007430 [Paramecium bursaria]